MRATGRHTHVRRGGLGPGVGETWVADGKSIDDFFAQGGAGQERIKTLCGHGIFDMNARQFIPAFFMFEVVGVIKIGGVGKIHTVEITYHFKQIFTMKIKKSALSII
ncbi:hypothetical protein [Janthinobacterium sp. SUN206]|uniref:hypothetical protein n=1 Tax=Janthinobacterium sp. SUN206 TaxID=3014787 RepID=UPI002713588F|nr:hypothetical protein [Janthinobacterium sp. SUN206]MDO8066960.1 hypothetical protein [Janthinobacterium sp. SUN206]